ncbi:hypothetical protein ACR9GP_24340, partial [Enterobacter ludwigii]
KADTHYHIQTSMTFFMRKLCLPLPTAKPLTWGQRWRQKWITLNRCDSEAHYSLIVSLHVSETDVNLLTPVQLKVDASPQV